MIDFKTGDAEGWLSLREASEKMGVSPVTLRAWADQGRVQSYRTPGGHRRFRVGDFNAPLKMEKTRGETRWRLLEHSALGRMQMAREEMETTRVALPSQTRAEQREMERALIQLCTQGIQKEQGEFETRAHALGAQYAKMNWRYGISTRDAVNGLGIFRRAFIASVVEFAFGVGEPNVDELNLWLGRANEIIDAVCVSMLEYRAEEKRASVGKR